MTDGGGTSTKFGTGPLWALRDMWASRCANEDNDLVCKVKFLAKDKANDPDQFYAILNILDAKANGLMSVNAFLGVFGVAFIEFDRTVTFSRDVELALTTVSTFLLLLLLMSTALCFMIVNVEWSFMQLLDKGADGYSTERELQYLARVVRERTVYYRVAWCVTAWSLAALAALAVAYVLE